jgi:hypothetical protein
MNTGDVEISPGGAHTAVFRTSYISTCDDESFCMRLSLQCEPLEIFH